MGGGGAETVIPNGVMASSAAPFLPLFWLAACYRNAL